MHLFGRWGETCRQLAPDHLSIRVELHSPPLGDRVDDGHAASVDRVGMSVLEPGEPSCIGVVNLNTQACAAQGDGEGSRRTGTYVVDHIGYEFTDAELGVFDGLVQAPQL
jgi:hypothetical protein